MTFLGSEFVSHFIISLIIPTVRIGFLDLKIHVRIDMLASTYVV